MIVACALALLSCQKYEKDYLDVVLPDMQPRLFAPAIVNTDSIEINAVFNSTCTELFFTRIIRKKFVLHHSEWVDGAWTVPTRLQMFSDEDAVSVAIDPTITADGKTMYFLGISPLDRARRSKPDIYVSRKVEGVWQLAEKVPEPISTDAYAESYPVVVADGSIYFESDRPGSLGKRDIFRAQHLEGGVFDTPQNIGPVVNSDETARSTYVTPDEKILIKANNSMTEKGFDVSFKVNDEWQKLIPVLFDEPLNNEWIYCCPYLSPDGKYFFYSRRYKGLPGKGWDGITKGEVYWVNADVIYQLRPKD